MQGLVTVTREEYSRLKRQAEIDVGFVKELVESISDIKAGRVKQVR